MTRIGHETKGKGCRVRHQINTNDPRTDSLT